VLTVMDSPAMTGPEYARPAFPNSWARLEGKGRVWYTSMGHREDVWTNPVFRTILTGGVRWACGDLKAEVPPNLKTAAPEAHINPAQGAKLKLACQRRVRHKIGGRNP
ncbi:MAG: hypothetical protein EBU49_11830, partial [Proteobacteria bacterium]|nr:hypothetical protein [Pseudomonadota bacterium]